MELVAGAPAGELILVGDFAAQQEAVFGGLLKGGEIPIVLKFVGGLVVVLGVVFLAQLLAVAGGLAGELGGVLDGESGDAGVREREMVGAEVVALLGLGVGLDGQVEAFGDLLRHGPDVGALGAGDDHVLGAAPGIEGIVVQVEGGLGGREQRVRGVVFGASAVRPLRRSRRGTARSAGASAAARPRRAPVPAGWRSRWRYRWRRCRWCRR